MNDEEKNKTEAAIDDGAASVGQVVDGDTSESHDESTHLRAQADEYLDGWKRAKADLINYKKDEAKRFEEIIRFAAQELVRELVPVLDSFDLALESLGSEPKVEKGVYLIRAQLEDALKKHGLEKIAVKAGDQFNPAVHEAVAAVESAQESGTVVEEVDRGYTLAGKLIRPARVKVAKEMMQK
ncbi:MAG: nucleotide exchange factor GrpE [Candidatus Paceibacterota bacterium]|jgi:molecular chaperone GrpE